MKRKRGTVKRKPKRPSVVTEHESIHTTNQYGLHGINEDQFESGMEARASEINNHVGSLRAGSEERGAANGKIDDNRTLLSGTMTGNQHKAARSITTRSSRRMGSSNTELANNEVLPHERTHQKEADLPHQDPQYKPQELNAALEVIKKVMQMGAAGPFNVPVDPIAQGIPDYFDVIDTPMDFGTIRANLEAGIKYLNSKEVFEDVQYIWENCSKYNKKGHYILELMKQVKKSFAKYWTEAGLYSPPPVGNDGPLRLPSMESTMKGNKHGHVFPMGRMADNPRHHQQDQMGVSPLELHQPSLSHSHRCQPQHKPCPCESCSVRPHPSQIDADINIGDAGHSHLHLTMESPMCWHARGSRYQVGTEADNPIHQQKNTGPYNSQLHQASASYKQQLLPYQRSFQCHPGSSLSHPFRPQAATTSCCAGHAHSHSPTESFMEHSTNGHGCLVGPTTGYANPQRPDQTGFSKPQLPHPPLTYIQPCQSQKWSCQCQSCTDPLQFCQGQSGKNIDGAGHNFSTPPPKSNMSCSKNGPRLTEVPMTDSASHQWQEEIHSSHGNPHKLLASHSQPQPSPPNVGTDNCLVDSSKIQKQRRGRGAARCQVLNSDGARISVATNELGQPIGKEASQLASYIGILARNGHLAPLTYATWREFPDGNKENMWQEVQKKFDIDPISKSWVVKGLARAWRNWKSLLKAAHYNTHETDEERLADRDKRVPADQWQVLISYWNSEEAQTRSMTNKANRAHMKMGHATGTKSFARIREEERAKRSDGKEPSQSELFIMTRTRKDGQPVNEASAAVISKIREQTAQQENSQNSCVQDDIFAKVVGHDKHGRVRTYGLGPSPSGLKSSRNEAIRLVSEAKSEVHEMKERVKNMEQTCAQMASQMATMMSMMSNMQQRRSQDEHVANVVAGVIAGISSGSEGSVVPLQKNSSAFPSTAPSNERRTTRGKKQSSGMGKVLSAGCTRSRSKLG